MALREVFARYGFDFTGQAKLNQANKDVDKLAKGSKSAEVSLGAAASGLVAALTGSALIGGIRAFAEQLDTLDDLSAQTHVATDDLQVLGYMAEKSGSSAGEMNAALTLLQKTLGKTADSSGPAVDALKSLKIDTSQPQELAAVLPQILENFKDLPNGVKKAEVATALFGRAGVRLIPLLERGSAGLEELRAELNESGGIVDANTIAKAGEFKDNIARMDRSMFALKGTLASAVFPQLSKVVETVAKGVGRLSDFTKQTTLAKTASIALGASLAGPVLRALLPFAGKGLKFLGIYAAVDDAIAFLDGKKSVIAGLLDGMFGRGAAKATRDWANDVIDSLFHFAASAEEAMYRASSANATATQVAIASWLGFFRDAANGFPAMSAALTAQLDFMLVRLDEFILAALGKWNSFVEKLVPSGPVGALIGRALQIDTSGVEARRDKARTTGAIEQTNADLAARGLPTIDKRRYADASQAEREFLLRDNVQRIRASNASAEGQIAARGPGRVERANAEIAARGDREAISAANATVQNSVLQAAAAQGTTATLNDNKTLTINFARGTDAEFKRVVTDTVQQALRDQNKSAIDAIVQIGKK